MQVVTPQLVHGKKVLLRLDIDVPLGRSTDYSLPSSAEDGRLKTEDLVVVEDFRLRAGIPTLKLCADHASKVIILGHLGRPFKNVGEEEHGNPPDLSAKPVCEWYKKELREEIEFVETLEQAEKSTSKLVMLENSRFFHGEVPGAEYHNTCTSKTCDIDFARHLASLVDPSTSLGTGFFVNEAFASYNPAASTTILPTLLPHAAGLRFSEEVKKLTAVRKHPKKPFIAIMGGAKVEDKLPVIKVLAGVADAVLVGGKLISEIREQNLDLPKNVLVGMLSEDGFDIAAQTTEAWGRLIGKAAEIVWNGPVGKFEDPKNEQTKKIAQAVLDSDAEIIIGGGDSIAALSQANLLQKAEEKAFVSTGGGAMLKFLTEGTLPTIDALK